MKQLTGETDIPLSNRTTAVLHMAGFDDHDHAELLRELSQWEEAGTVDPQDAAFIRGACAVLGALDKMPCPLMPSVAPDLAERALAAAVAVVASYAAAYGAEGCAALACVALSEELGSPLRVQRRMRTWRRHTLTRSASTRPKSDPATSTRPRGTRRERQAKTSKTAGGCDPGDPDPDPDDLIERKVRELAGEAPPLSPQQRQRLTHLFGGGVR